MKLGVFAVLFGDKSLEEALDYIAESGLEAVEIGAGGFPGDSHCKPRDLLGNESRLNRFKQAVKSRGLEISALSCHGNPLHPNPEIARRDHEVFEQTVRLAARLGVENVITFSGCPGESEHSSESGVGHLPLARRVFLCAEMAVGGKGDSLLGGTESILEAARGAGGD